MQDSNWRELARERESFFSGFFFFCGFNRRRKFVERRNRPAAMSDELTGDESAFVEPGNERWRWLGFLGSVSVKPNIADLEIL